MTQPDRRNEKKAFIEIKVLRMETINPSFSDGKWCILGAGHHDLTLNY